MKDKDRQNPIIKDSEINNTYDKVVLAIDLGATSGRVIAGAFKDEKFEHEEITRFKCKCYGTVNDSIHLDILSLFEEIKNGLKVATKKYGKIESLSIATWGVDYGLLQDGKLIGDPFQYRDKRTERGMEKVHNIIPKEELYKKTGIQSMPFNTVYQLSSESTDLTDKKLLFVPDLLNYMLTGNMYNEYTIASTSGLLDIESRGYNKEILAKLNIPESLFCEIVMPGAEIGFIKEDILKEAGQKHPVKVIASASHDTQSAIASIEMNENDGYLIAGTWSLMGIENDKYFIDDYEEDDCFTHEGGVNKRFSILKNVTGFFILENYINQQTEKFTYEEIEKLARENSSFTSTIDVNDISFFTEEDMSKKIVDYCIEHNQIPPSKTGEFINLCYLSLAKCYKNVLDSIEKKLKVKLERLIFLGGGTKNIYFSEMIEKEIGVPVVRCISEATSAGIFIMQSQDKNTKRSIIDSFKYQ